MLHHFKEFKFAAIQKYCILMGWKYLIITEKKINSVRLDNIKDLITSAKHYSLSTINKDIGILSKRLKHF